MPSDTIQYSLDHMLAAMCIWEEMCGTTVPDAGEPWADLREQVGACEMRELVITHLAVQCDAAWHRAYELFEQAHQTWNERRMEHEQKDKPFYDSPPTEPAPFDWQFVPFWLRTAVDWSDHLNGPQVIGT